MPDVGEIIDSVMSGLGSAGRAIGQWGQNYLAIANPGYRAMLEQALRQRQLQIQEDAAARAAQLAPYQLEHQRLQNTGLETTNAALRSQLDDAIRLRDEAARAESAVPRLLEAGRERAAVPGRLTESLQPDEDPEAAAFLPRTANTPALPAARTYGDLADRGVRYEDISAVEKHRPKVLSDLLGLVTPQAQATQTGVQEAIGKGDLTALAQALAQSDPNKAATFYATETKPFPVKPGEGIASRESLAAGNLLYTPPSAGETRPVPEAVPGFPGMVRTPKVNDQTGRVEWSIQYDPNYRAGVVTHADALRSLQAQGKIRGDTDLTSLTSPEHAAVVNEMTRLQARAAGERATQVTVHTGEAKLDLPIGAAASQWLNEKGEFPNPDMPVGYVQKHYFPQKDALKRMDSEGQSRVFLQHIQMLREKAANMFPEETGNPVVDAVTARVAALARQARGQSDKDLAAIVGVDRPAALQMASAVATGVRNGQRLLQSFEEITSPYRPWTKQSYLAALDALEGLAKTRLAQVGRPGMNPQPNIGGQVPPASPHQTSPAPAVNSSAAPSTAPTGAPRILNIERVR